MPQAKQESKFDLTAVTALLAGSAIALAASIAVLALTAWLIAGGRLGEDWAARAGLIGAFLGCLIGGGYAVRCVKKRALLVGLAVSALFLLWWVLFEVLISGGNYNGNGVSLVISSVLGGGLSGILFASGKKRRK